MQIREQTVTLADGTTFALMDWYGALDHVKLPWGGQVRNRHGLPKDHCALITSILVATATPMAPTPDLGQLAFWYNGTQRFVAPIVALMNRYHGLTSLQGLLGRFRLLINPSTNTEDFFQDGFNNGIVEPIHIRENLQFEVEHVPPNGPVGDISDFVVEFQTMTFPFAYPIWSIKNPK